MTLNIQPKGASSLLSNVNIAKLLEDVASSHLQNYAGVPGLQSALIGGPSHGKVRLFHATREPSVEITPHSHRFNLLSIVLQGSVTNTQWHRAIESETCGDEFAALKLLYAGEPGAYEHEPIGISRYYHVSRVHKAGEAYFMRATDIHSIRFSKGAVVLLIEGPTVSDSSVILQAHVNGKTLDTFQVKDWMFESVA